jgi:cytochrome b561
MKKEISFNQPYSAALRLWHWTTALTIVSSIVLVLLGSTMFRTRDNIVMVQEQLQQKGIEVSRDQARAVAHEYSDKVWMAHKWVGYGLCFLLLSRFVIGLNASREDSLANKIKAARAIVPSMPGEKEDRRHFITVKSGYRLFYLIFFLMGLTGLGLAFEDVEFLKPIHEAIKTTHEYLQYAIYTFLFLHLSGVILSDLGKFPGIVSRMIHGGGVRS